MFSSFFCGTAPLLVGYNDGGRGDRTPFPLENSGL